DFELRDTARCPSSHECVSSKNLSSDRRLRVAAVGSRFDLLSRSPRVRLVELLFGLLSGRSLWAGRRDSRFDSDSWEVVDAEACGRTGASAFPRLATAR